MMEIKPLVGLGDVKLGMTHIEVEKFLGKPISTSNISYKGKSWDRFIFKNDIDCDIEKNKTIYITISRRAKDIFYKGLNVFETEPFEVLRKLETDSAKAYESVGIVIFPSLGIGTTGFHDGDEDEKTIGIAYPTEWNITDGSWKPISFL